MNRGNGLFVNSFLNGKSKLPDANFETTSAWELYSHIKPQRVVSENWILKHENNLYAWQHEQKHKSKGLL